MGKRILSFLLALVMVVGLIPATAIPTFAAETNATVNTFKAFVAEDIAVDGSLTEIGWLTGGKLSGGQAFDILWDGGNLYFAVVPGESDTNLTVKVGDSQILTADKATGAAAIEASVEYTTKNVTSIENVTLAVGESTWTGTVELVKYARTTQVTSATLGGDYTGTTYDNGWDISMPAVADNTTKDYRSYALKTGVSSLANRGDGVWFECAIDPTELTAHSGEAQSASAWTANAGFNALLIGPNKERIVFGIDNITDKGLMFIIQTVTWGQRATYFLDRTAEEGVFYLGLEWTADGVVNLHVNGEYLTSFADMEFVHPSETTVNAMIVEGRRFRSYNTIPVDFKVYDVVFSTPVEVDYAGDAPYYMANVCSGAVTLDGVLDDMLWSAPYDMPFVTGTGVSGLARMAWYRDMLYVGVKHSGASSMELSLGEKNWTIDLTAADIATADGIVTGKNANGIAELKIDLFKSGVEVLDYNQEESFQVKLVGDTGTAALGEVYANLVFASDETLRFTVPTTSATHTKVDDRTATITGSGRKYLLLSSSNINHAFDVYYKQTLTINALPGADGTVNGVHTANGLSVAIMDTKAAGTASVIFPKDQDLWIRVAKPDSQYEDFALGKKLGETFTLGYLWKADDTACIFVDNTLIAEVKHATYAINWAENYFASNVPSTMSGYDLTIQDPTFTYGSNKTAPVVTTAKALGTINTSAVTGNLPTRYEYGHFAFNVTWNSDNKDVIAADGTVTQPALDDAVVNVAAVVGGEARETVAVTVPADTPADMMDAAIDAPFVDMEPTASFHGWTMATWEKFTECQGSAAALVYNQKVYLAVNATGSVSATLGEETKTVEANGLTILSFDNTAVTEYGQEIALNLSLDGNAVWVAEGKVVVGQAVANRYNALPGNKAVIKSDVVSTTVEGIHIVTTEDKPMFNHQNCGYWIQNNVDGLVANAYDSTKDVLLEQILQINALPVGDVSGGYQNTPPSPVNGWGLTIMFEVPSLSSSGKYDQFSNVVFADAEGNLYLTGLHADSTLLTSVALGKSLGDEFKLGLLYGLDNTTTVFVDGVKVGTYENTRYLGGTYKTYTLMYKYMDPADQDEGKNADIVIKNISLTNVGVVELANVEDEITQEVIFGSMDLDNVTGNLPLSATFQTAYLGEKTLRWTSSNEDIIETDGTVHPSLVANKKVTLTVYLEDSETPLWSVEVHVPAASAALNALLSEEPVVVDGNLSEAAYLDWIAVNDVLSGNIAAAWTKGYAFLAVHSKDAETLKLTFNGKEITVDLTTGTASGLTGVTAARNAKTGVVEIGIPLSAVGFNLTDYNQTATMTAQLVKGETVVAIPMELLNFSGNIAELQAMANFTKDNGPWTLLTNSIGYKGTNPGKLAYVFKTNNGIDHNELFIMSNEFLFEALPISDGAYTVSATQGNGAFFYYGDENETTRAGKTIAGTIFTEDGTNLKLRISGGQNQEGHVFDLGKTLNEKFRITQYWYPNDDLVLYVDGVLLATIKNASLTTSYLGIDVITFRYYSAKASADKVEFTLSNWTNLVTKYETVLDELTQNAVFGRVDLEHVQKDLPLVTTFASANFEALTLKWTSSDESVVAADGKVTRHATEAKSSLITVYFVDADGNEIELWSVTVTVDPMTVTKQPAPAIIHTGFARPDAIKIDGVIEADEHWLFNGWVLNDDQQPVAYFATQWDEENLYIALDTELDKINVFVGSFDFGIDMANAKVNGVEAAFNGTVVELKIPFEQFLGISRITDYGQTINITIYDDDYYEGTLKLTNVSWWATDNIYAGLPMLANNVKSVKMGTADVPDGNQGAKQLENGWRVYDLYGGEDAANPAGIRTYILFMKMPVYENFADRTEATHIEFDFYAKALPVWEWDEGAKDELSRAFANYGVTFSLSDKADSGKNSNVAVFGIVNTEEGLVLVVNRGRTDMSKYPLNKQVGEEFRIGMTWLTNSNLVLTIDGVEITTINDMSKWVNSVGDTSFVVNMLRNKVKPTSEADNMDVYLTNIGFGKAHNQEDIIRNLTFADIAGENESEEEIISNLELPAYMTNGQLKEQYPITWISSDPSTINVNGEVTRPETGVKVVTLTAYLDNTTTGIEESKSFTLIVLGKNISNGNAQVVLEDVNPFAGAATEYTGLLFNLDKTNNSIVYVIPEGEETKINLVTLTDVDLVSRLNRESLRLFVSDDNATYTEIENYKLHNDGGNWYLYGFEADARYIKVHFTHRDSDDSNFANTPGEMIHVSWNESLVVPENAAEIAVPATTLLDQAVAIELPDGITAAGLRIALNGEILFHYVDKNGTVYVRIADPTEGTLKLWNAEDIELSDKENVYEVTYGTRETLPASGRWVLGMKAGQTFPDGSSLSVDTLYRASGKSISKSTDGGYTWTNVGTVNFPDDSLSSGGWGIDSKTGRLFHEYYGTAAFSGSDITVTKCITYVFYSDDGGKTWTKASGLGQVEGDLQSNYVLSYTDLTELAGNDGEGPNVDFVFPMGAQYNNNGAFCGRVAYTTDGGLTWHYSESKITYGNETAFEGGVSEATILEREDGTLVYYARCQSNGVDNFTISYSLDHGVTWLTPGATSSIYTTNTQALMMTYDFDGFDGNRTTGAPIFMWGGNNVLGGNSYMRMPLNFAVSTNGMETWRNIQNIFFKTFQDVYTTEADHYITNPSIQQIDGDDMYIAYSRLYHKDSVYMVVNNFTDWFVRTKGAYDSFERGDGTYEGWVASRGIAEAFAGVASEGNYSLLIKENTQVTRSVPYLQNGTLSIDLFVDGKSDFVFELQPAFSNEQMKCAVISAEVNGTTMTFHDGTVLTLKEGWNTVFFDLELTEYAASVTVNDGEAQAIEVNEQFNGNNPHELGNYITYVTILSTSNVYVDELLIISELDAVLEATTTDKTAASALVELIKSIGDVTIEDTALIESIRETYEAMTQVQQDLVNRRVPTGTSTNANDEGAMVNYYAVLVAAEEELKAITPALPVITGNLSLNDTVDINFIIPAGIDVEENVLVVKNAATEADVEYTTMPGTGGTTVVRFSAKSNHMTDEITVQVFDSNGNALTQMASMSVRKYAQKLLANCDDTLKMLLIRMLDYGALAQINSGVTTDLANNIVDDELRAFADTYKWAEVKTPEVPAGSGGVFQAYLALNETIDVTVSVASSYVASGDKFVVKCNGEELSEDDYILVEQSNSYLIRCSVNSDEMSDEIYIAIVGEDGAVKKETTLGVRIYAQKFLAAVSTGNQAAMLLAMLDYGALSQIYSGTNTDDLANCFVTDALRQALIGYAWPKN